MQWKEDPGAMLFKWFTSHAGAGQDQVPEQPPPADSPLVEALSARDGQRTVVVLRDGRRCDVFDIFYGYDMGDAYAHVVANLDPGAPGQRSEFFTTDQVVALLDVDGVQLYP